LNDVLCRPNFFVSSLGQSPDFSADSHFMD
jgi:hypothetical protein